MFSKKKKKKKKTCLRQDPARQGTLNIQSFNISLIPAISYTIFPGYKYHKVFIYLVENETYIP